MRNNRPFRHTVCSIIDSVGGTADGWCHRKAVSNILGGGQHVLVTDNRPPVVAAVIGDEPKLLEPNVPVDTRKRPREHSIIPPTSQFADPTPISNV